MDWRPIATLKNGEHVLLYFPYGECGVGAVETAMVFRDVDKFGREEWSFWTHGGPNSGSDWQVWENGEGEPDIPTHWMPVPESPK